VAISPDPGIATATVAAMEGRVPRGPDKRVLTQGAADVRTKRRPQRLKKCMGIMHRSAVNVVQTASGPYAEAAHVKPIGRPIDGPPPEQHPVLMPERPCAFQSRLNCY